MRWLLLLVLFASAPVHADPFATAMQNVRDGQHAAAAAGFHALAQQGDATAAHNLAILFALGRGVPQNRAEAAYWALSALFSGLEQAAPLADLMLAELGDVDRVGLATRLETLLSPKATKGDGQSMLALAVVLALVRPERDLLAAYAWQNIAAAQDISGADRARALTLSMMSPTEQAQAQGRAWSAFVDWCLAQMGDTPPSCDVIATVGVSQPLKSPDG